MQTLCGKLFVVLGFYFALFHFSLPCSVLLCLAWLGLALLCFAWLGLAWLGLAWLGFALLRFTFQPSHPSGMDCGEVEKVQEHVQAMVQAAYDVHSIQVGRYW